MKHLGSITELSGKDVPIVDIVTGGSPCQNLSVAGNRMGLQGSESKLFLEQIRLIKEMRKHDEERSDRRADEPVRPRYMVWENVAGAFSSNHGEDFRIVLEETCKIADENAVIPRPPKGKWAKSGTIMGNGWSVSWRLHDAQFWGVPQRRKRIALIADFGGQSAPEILFEQEGVSGNIEPGSQKGKGPSSDSDGSIKETICVKNGRDNVSVTEDNVSLTTTTEGHIPSCICFEPRSQDGTLRLSKNDVSPTLNTAQGGQRQPCVLSGVLPNDISPTLDANYFKGPGSRGAVEREVVGILMDQGGTYMETDEETGKVGTLRANSHQHEPMVYNISSFCSKGMLSDNPNVGFKETEIARTLDVSGGNPVCHQGGILICDTEKQDIFCLQGNSIDRTEYSGCNGAGWREDKSYTLNTKDRHAIAITHYQNLNHAFRNNAYDIWEKHEIGATLKATGGIYGGGSESLISNASIVRRLTPLECERLQGFPDNWTNIGKWTDSKGKKHKDADTPRYKALGNSIALPFWQWMAHRMLTFIEGHTPTMASLFDGIGGFPLVYQREGCIPIWASEIEEFPIAVTKLHFGEE